MSKSNVMTLPVEFTGVSANRETASVGIKIDRSEIEIATVEETFCGHRLTAELRLGANNGQKTLPGVETEEAEPIEATWDAMRYSAGKNEFTSRLRTTKDVDIGLLSEYAGKKGRVLVRKVEEIPEPEPKGIVPDEDLNEARGKVAPLGKGQKDPVSALGLSPAMTERLENAGYGTVGELLEFIRSDEWWHRKIKGFGKVAVDKITDAITAWSQAQPAEDDPDM